MRHAFESNQIQFDVIEMRFRIMINCNYDNSKKVNMMVMILKI